MDTEAILWTGLAVLGFGFAISAANYVYLCGAFWRHLENAHPAEWARIDADHLPANVFLSALNKGSTTECLWKSREDFGDPKVGVLRAKVTLFRSDRNPSANERAARADDDPPAAARTDRR